MNKMQYYREEAKKLGLTETYFINIGTTTRIRLEKEDGKDLVEKYKNLFSRQEKEIETFLSNCSLLAKSKELKKFALFLVEKKILNNHRNLYLLKERMSKKRKQLLKEDTLEKIISINKEYKMYIKLHQH